MRGIFKLACAATLAAFASRTLAAPITKVTPGGVDSIIISANNTINATHTAPANASSSSTSKTTKLTTVKVSEDFAATTEDTTTTTTGTLPLSLVNNYDGAINAYVTGLDTDDQLVMLSPDGSWYYPTATSADTTPVEITADVAIPLGAQGSTTTVTLPGYISSARVWFAAGDLKFYTVWSSATAGPSLVEPSSVNPSDPSAAVDWGFVELTNTEDDGLYANISYVDFVGLALGMSLLSTDGTTQTAEGVASTAVATICAALVAQTAIDGQPWGDLCQVTASGSYLRAIAPGDYISLNTDAFDDYFTDYIDDVWTYYTTNTLTIDTQASAGDVACTVVDDLLTCAGDNRGYDKPVAADIFGCNSGPFLIESTDNDIHQAVVPRLCAAFDRTTLMLSGGDVQPALASTDYYLSAPTNYYSKFVHESELDGKGYAFSYDDVNPSGENESGVVSCTDPETLTITIGGWS